MTLVAQGRMPRLSLRSKGVAGLTVPMAALFATLFAVYFLENEARHTDQEVARVYEARTQLLELRIRLADPAHSLSSLQPSLTRLSSAFAGDASALEVLNPSEQRTVRQWPLFRTASPHSAMP